MLVRENGSESLHIKPDGFGKYYLCEIHWEKGYKHKNFGGGNEVRDAFKLYKDTVDKAGTSRKAT